MLISAFSGEDTFTKQTQRFNHTVMKNEIMALQIEIRRSNKQLNPFFFNDTMLHAISSGLRAVYDEVFIWSMDKYFAVWVVGNSPELLVRSFAHHSQFYKRTSLLRDEKALDLFGKIVENKTWKYYNAKAKLETFENGLSLSDEISGVGSILSPIVNEHYENMLKAPQIKGYTNAWRYTGKDFISLLESKIAIGQTTYRVSVN